MDPREQHIVYYDGWCSMCTRSAEHFRKLDKGRGIIRCVDLRSDDPLLELASVDREQLAKSLHTRQPSGELLSGPEAIRAVYQACGKGWRLAWTRLPIIRNIVNACYRVFAKHRLRWFGTQDCDDGSCAIPPKN